MGVTGGIRPTPRNVAFMSDQIPGGPEGPNNWQVIGVSRDQWKLLAASLDLGGNVRAGLEDNLYLPDGEMARSNGDLIAKARQMAEDIGRRAATVAEAREMLGAEPRERRERRCRSPTSGSSTSRGCCPGGFCSQLLADFGADVVKVEDTGMGDYVRWAPPLLRRRRAAGARHPLGALPVAEPQQALDPPRPEVRGRPRRAAAAGRATSTSCSRAFAPGVLDRLGVGYERMREENPALVYCAITGYGQTGPNTPARRATT